MVISHKTDLLSPLIILSNITLLKGLSADLMLTGVFQSWSLTTELCFYLVAPMMFFLMRRIKIVWLQVVPIVLIGLLLVMLFKAYPLLGFFESVSFMFNVTFFGRCVEFLFGIHLALIVIQRKKQFRLKKKFPWATLLGSLLMIFCLVFMQLISRYFNVNHASESTLGLVFNNTIFPLSVTVFLYGLIYESSLINRFFSSKLIESLGKSSYAFYLIHAGFISDFVIRKTGNVIVAFFVLQLISVIIYKAIEHPMYRLIIGRTQPKL
jgi:peptidoglycan/LPS O-acetylase OafA/YrhL